MNAPPRWQRWLGWFALATGCARDNDEGCETVDDCPPPCLFGDVDIELVVEEPDSNDYPTNTMLPGSGTWIFDVEIDGEHLSCSATRNDTDCNGALSLSVNHLAIARSPSTFTLAVRYVDLTNNRIELFSGELEAEYALPESEEICGACPMAALAVDVPIDAIPDAELPP